MTAHRDDELAWFVVHLGLSPTDYWQLTVRQRNAIVREANRAAQQRRR